MRRLDCTCQSLESLRDWVSCGEKVLTAKHDDPSSVLGTHGGARPGLPYMHRMQCCTALGKACAGKESKGAAVGSVQGCGGRKVAEHQTSASSWRWAKLRSEQHLVSFGRGILSHFSSAVVKHHNQGNFQKSLFGLMVQKGESVVVEPRWPTKGMVLERQRQLTRGGMSWNTQGPPRWYTSSSKAAPSQPAHTAPPAGHGVAQ